MMWGQCRNGSSRIESKEPELAGVSRKSVSNWEIGKTVPRRSALIAIAFATGVNLYWLETGESPYPPEPVKDAKPGNSMV